MCLCAVCRFFEVKKLSDEQKEMVQSLSSPNQIPVKARSPRYFEVLDVKERRVLYAAMDRRFDKPGHNVNILSVELSIG